jgi:hypothetical protein
VTRVEVPPEFRADVDADGAVDAAAKFLAGRGVSVPSKARIRAIAWDVHRLGGGATTARARLRAQHQSLVDLRARMEAYRARHEEAWRIAEAERDVAGAERGLATLQALVEAAGAAPNTDVVVRGAAYSDAKETLHRIRGDLVPLRRARVVSAARTQLEDAEREAERTLATAEKAYTTGRARLTRLSADLTAAERAYRSTLVEALQADAVRMGRRIAELVGADVDFLTRNPHRAPDEVGVLYALARKAGDLGDALGDAGVFNAFGKAAGKVPLVIAEGKAGLVRHAGVTAGGGTAIMDSFQSLSVA